MVTSKVPVLVVVVVVEALALLDAPESPDALGMPGIPGIFTQALARQAAAKIAAIRVTLDIIECLPLKGVQTGGAPWRSGGFGRPRSRIPGPRRDDPTQSRCSARPARSERPGFGE
jgi:hypothetical protein